jgi:Fic family protein
MKLGELKGIVQKLPNQSILINSLVLQEAKDSSAVENIITTHDELFRANIEPPSYAISKATKEVLNYSAALKYGFSIVKDKGILPNSLIHKIQEILEPNQPGFRAGAGTRLVKSDGTVVYVPPQGKIEIEQLMANLEKFINDDEISDLDPLVKMAVIHHQFESIHPFYDGNGRTGRIINILYLITQELLDLPILYLSHYIIQNKTQYYELLQSTRDNDSWENWLIYMLKGVEETADNTISLVKEISKLMLVYKHKIREMPGKIYSQDLINNLFSHPYTKISFIQDTLKITKPTAIQYLEKLVSEGLLKKVKLWRDNYYLNIALWDLFMNWKQSENNTTDIIITSNEN